MTAANLFPVQYEWIKRITAPPKMIAEGIKLVGLREYPGKAENNPLIMSMATDIGVRAIYPDDETHWCALSQNWLCWKTGKPLAYASPQKSRYDLLRAKSFVWWGVSAAIPMLGDVLVFERPKGFHVGMYAGEDITHYHVLGGNQNNSYGFARLEKKRLIVSRRFYKIAAPASVKQIFLAPEGQISLNEI